ncbi:MAG: metallophosphoesterase [Thermomicrobiales bacterium]
MTISILAVTDEADPRIYSETLRQRMGHVAFVVSCGDLPVSYLEFISDSLNKPVYYVHGNHEKRCGSGRTCEPGGATDIGGKVITDPETGIILAGIPGCLRYEDESDGQYAEWQIGLMAQKMRPKLTYNKLRHGRALDLFVTHAPPRDVNDRQDPAHRGFRTLRDFLRQWQPPIHLHGHIHLYDRSQPSQQRFHETDVINVFPYKLLELDPARLAARVEAEAPYEQTI